MSYRSSGGRRRKTGAALVISYLVQAAVVLLVAAAVLLLVRGAQKAFGMAASTLQPQDSSVSAGPDVSTQPDVSSPQPGAASTLPSASQSAQPQVPDPTQEPAVPAVVEPKGIVVLDPGHGGIDPGCGEVGSLEKDIVLAISLYIQERLSEQNVTVVMTRDTDKYVSLDDRTAIANDAAADLFVSVHCNAFEGKASGLECYYYKNEEGEQMAVDITATAAGLGIKTREVRSQNYQVLRGTKMPAVLVETGFLTDADECALLMTPEYQEKVADAIVQAVMTALDEKTAPLA